MNTEQQEAIERLAARYHTVARLDQFFPTFDLPAGYVAGWVGPIYVGVDPQGEISS